MCNYQLAYLDPDGELVSQDSESKEDLIQLAKKLPMGSCPTVTDPNGITVYPANNVVILFNPQLNCIVYNYHKLLAA